MAYANGLYHIIWNVLLGQDKGDIKTGEELEEFHHCTQRSTEICGFIILIIIVVTLHREMKKRNTRQNRRNR